MKILYFVLFLVVFFNFYPSAGYAETMINNQSASCEDDDCTIEQNNVQSSDSEKKDDDEEEENEDEDEDEDEDEKNCEKLIDSINESGLDIDSGDVCEN